MSLIKWCSAMLLTALMLSGCDESGPGMTVTWATLDRSRYISLESIKLPSGIVQKRSTAITFKAAKVEGMAPDNRVIPAWVELSWLEPVDYVDPKSAPPMADQLAEDRRLPIKTQRVEVGSRIPAEVIAQAMESIKQRKPSELPDKFILVYFTWFEGQVSLRWELRDRSRVSGGKVIDSGS